LRREDFSLMARFRFKAQAGSVPDDPPLHTPPEEGNSFHRRHYGSPLGISENVKSPLGRGVGVGPLGVATNVQFLLSSSMPRKKIVPYDQHLKLLARQLRNRSTLAEILLWRQLKAKKMLGYDFDRQKPIDRFIVDFFCSELMLGIEIDGESHPQNPVRDQERQVKLERLGVRFLRFEDRMVKQDMRNVLRSIESWIFQNAKKKHY
jgi:very-short-patch-repair endonuclease